MGVFCSAVALLQISISILYLISVLIKYPFGEFMRKYGSKVLYVLFLIAFTLVYRNYLVEDISQKETVPEYRWYWLLLIWTFRICAIIQFIPAVFFMITYFFVPLPPVPDPATRDLSQNYEEPVTKGSEGADNGEYAKNGEKSKQEVGDQKKHHLSYFVIRIITRGDYPDLIRRNVTHHIRLMEKYCDCDRIEAHVVTENPLEGDYKVGRKGWVREIRVPSSYQSPFGTLYKARNVNYWMHNYPKDMNEMPADKTWILALDEDSFVDDTFVKDFLERFVQSGAQASVSPSIIDLPPTASVLTGFEESFFFTLQVIGMWFEAGILKKTPLWFRGAAYVIQFEVEKKIGWDFSPEMSISEDHSFGHYFSDGGYKIGYINGWNWEWGAPGVMGLIQQRARWFRGLVKGTLNMPVSVNRQMWEYYRWLQTYVVNGAVMFCLIMITIVWFSNFQFGPVGPSLFLLDYITPYVAATFFYGGMYGCWYVMSTRQAVFTTMLSCCWVGIIITFLIHFTSIIWMVITLIDDFIHGSQRYEVTAKKET